MKELLNTIFGHYVAEISLILAMMVIVTTMAITSVAAKVGCEAVVKWFQNRKANKTK